MKDYPPYLDYPKERKPQTNYDQIISKSPEELSEWLSDVAWWLSAYEGKVHPILKGLKSPVEDNK